MFCKFCGKEVEENSNFCASCGKEMEFSQVKKTECQTSGINIKDNIIWIVLIILGVMILAVCIFNTNRLSENEVCDLVIDNHIQNYEEYELEMKSIKMLTQKVKNKTTIVVCEIESSNELICVNKTCEIVCKKVENEWEVDEYQIVEVNDILPMSGYHNEKILTDEEQEYVLNLYPEIEWADRYSVLSRGMDVGIDIDDVDLENKKNQRIYNYAIGSNTANIHGEIEFNYVFENGEWTLDSAKHENVTYEWDLEGLYEFREGYNYFGAIYITTVDWQNQNAHIYYYGSQSDPFNGTYTDDCWVEFTEGADGIRFEEFEFKTSPLERANRKFKFMATIEDLYYVWSYGEPSTTSLGVKVGGVKKSNN